MRTDISRGIPDVEFVSEENAGALTHLILVPGHAITVRESLRGVDRIDDVWYLLDYQHEKGVPAELVRHIQEGVKAAAADPASLLLFSGGATRRVAGPRTEGGSYFSVADHFRWWGSPHVRARAAAEEFARDSLENLMFSVCRFHEMTGHYPSRITVVGYSFKQRRFETAHRGALRFPRESFAYVGVVPDDGVFDLNRAIEGEIANSLIPFRRDPYACNSESGLPQKRAQRNPFQRSPPYVNTCPEMSELLHYCGPVAFPQPLPWNPMGGPPDIDSGDWTASAALPFPADAAAGAADAATAAAGATAASGAAVGAAVGPVGPPAPTINGGAGGGGAAESGGVVGAGGVSAGPAGSDRGVGVAAGGHGNLRGVRRGGGGRRRGAGGGDDRAAAVAPGGGSAAIGAALPGAAEKAAVAAAAVAGAATSAPAAAEPRALTAAELPLAAVVAAPLAAGSPG